MGLGGGAVVGVGGLVGVRQVVRAQVSLASIGARVAGNSANPSESSDHCGKHVVRTRGLGKDTKSKQFPG